MVCRDIKPFIQGNGVIIIQILYILNIFQEEDAEEDSESEAEDTADTSSKGADYDYLLGMPMWNLTKEKKEQILKERDDKKQELKDLQAKTEKDLWKDDISKFLEEVSYVF